MQIRCGNALINSIHIRAYPAPDTHENALVGLNTHSERRVNALQVHCPR